MSLAARLEPALRTVEARLAAERHPDGFWVGELASSSLATATAIVALRLADREAHAGLVRGGLAWLASQQNADGGFGDTDRSLSNISTTMLCRAALTICDPDGEYRANLQRCEEWLFTRYGSTREELTQAVRARYGKDNTFAVPILMMCALAGLVEWSAVPFLPFPMAVFPQSMYRMLRLSVVSYALPALIAIGQVIHARKRSWNPLASLVRRAAIRPTLRVLERIQPTSGGYLEATPLTSFVVMSLVSSGQAGHRVVKQGVKFLAESVRPDGSWPIDTNLSTWVTTLAINGLCADPSAEVRQRDEVAGWLLEQQMKTVHPYTGAAPGGWGWTPLSGSVPDADDTPGAILSLIHLKRLGADVPAEAIRNGMVWLAGLANGDGGMPTFCRGWGQLPFDRSGSDLTAHALRAIHVGSRFLGEGESPTWVKLIDRGFRYLAKQQRADGAWLPLWFGNQNAPGDDNPVYGTARVLMAYRDTARADDPACRRGVSWLMSVRNADGGWGGAKDCPSTVEETSVALDALCGLLPPADLGPSADWLLTRIEGGDWTHANPIGFYFAKLWYYEKLYPATFAAGALSRLRMLVASR